MAHTLEIRRRTVADACATVTLSGTDITLAVAPDAREGDYGLTYITATGQTTITVPDGWVQLAVQDASTGLRSWWFYRWLTDDDAGVEYTWTIGAANDIAGVTVAYPGVDPDNPSTVVGDDSPAGTVHTTPAVTVPADGWLVSAAAGRHNTTGVVTGWSDSDTDDDLLVNEGSAATTPDISHAVFDSGRPLSAGSASRTLTATQSEAMVVVWSIALRPATVTYPEEALGKRLEMAFGANPDSDPATWTWTDVSAYMYVDDAIDIKWGRGEGSTQAEPSEMEITLKNTDGRFTAEDPRSPLWPYIVEGLPIRYSINPGSGWRTRFSGFVFAWPLEWPGRSRHMALARIKCNGRFRQMNAGDPPEESALRRTTIANTEANGVVAYWPCEDRENSQFVASGLPGGLPMTYTGTVEFASYQMDASFGLDRSMLPVLDLKDGGQLRGQIISSTRTPIEWTVVVRSFNNALTVGSNVYLAEWYTPGGTYVKWQLRQNSSNADEELIGVTNTGAQTVVLTSNGLATGIIQTYTIRARQNGTSVDVTWGDLDSVLTTTLASHTLARPTLMIANPASQVTSPVFPWAHAMVTDRYDSVDYTEFVIGPNIDVDEFDYTASAFWAWYAENAHERIARLGEEDGIGVTVVAVDDAYRTKMDGQHPEATLPLMRKCEQADMGLLTELGFGVLYVPRGALYDRPVDIVIDVAQRQLTAPFNPVKDDARRRNSWEVKRDGGSSAVYTNEANAALRGTVSASHTVYSVDDSQLPYMAQWLAALGSQEELRYPAMGVNLLRSPALMQDWLDIRSASRAQVVNLLPQHPPSGVDQLVIGGTERFKGAREWSGSMVGVPYRPYLTWEFDADGNQGRLDTDGSTLAIAATDDDTVTVLHVVTANHLNRQRPLWTEDAGSFPFTVEVAGEPMTVTNIGPAVVDPYDRITASSWGAPDVGPGAPDAYVLSGGAAGDFAVSAGTGRITNNSVNVLRFASLDIGAADFDLEVDVSWTVGSATTAAWSRWICARSADLSNYYVAHLSLSTAGVVSLSIQKRVAGTLTALDEGGTSVSASTTNTANDRWRVRFAGSGTDLRAIAQNLTVVASPSVVVHGSDNDLTTGGNIRLGERLETGSGNTGAVGHWDNLTVYNPQRFTVVRGIQDWTKALPVGSTVRLYRPSGIAR